MNFDKSIVIFLPVMAKVLWEQAYVTHKWDWLKYIRFRRIKGVRITEELVMTSKWLLAVFKPSISNTIHGRWHFTIVQKS